MGEKVKYDKWSLNLNADVRGDPTIFENAMCKMFCIKFRAVFSTDISQDSNLLLVLLNVSTDEIAALTTGCSYHHRS